MSRPTSGKVETKGDPGRHLHGGAQKGDGADEDALSDVLRVQIRILKEEKASAEKAVAAANEEAEKWKREAFASLNKRTELREEDVRKSSLYLGTITQLAQVKGELNDANRVLNEQKTELAELRAAAERSRRLVEQDKKLDSLERSLLDAEGTIREQRAQMETLKKTLQETKNRHEETSQAMQDTIAAQARELEALRLDVHAYKTEQLGSTAMVDAAMAGRWKVPASERIIDYRYCSRNGVPGYLYVLTSQLVYEPSVLGVAPLVIPIHRLLSVDKVKTISWLPGKGSALEIQFLDENNKETVLSLGSFFHRKEAVRSIVAQAERLRVPIRILRGGKADSNS